jgi:tRNA pseudouridine55 synthase
MASIPYSGTPDNGLYLVYKPQGWTSFDLVKFLHGCLSRRYDKRVKVGHAGTLDPLAEGLMILASGNQTKRLAEWIADKKKYLAKLKLGETTASHDRETPVEKIQPLPPISLQELDQRLDAFRGKINQTPPLFSAVKVKGQRAYDLARAGKKAELTPRVVEIYDLNILRWEPPFLTLSIYCSKGTYIRSLTRDIGDALGTGAVLEYLLRTHSGNFSLEDAVTLDELKAFCSEGNGTSVSLHNEERL